MNYHGGKPTKVFHSMILKAKDGLKFEVFLYVLKPEFVPIRHVCQRDLMLSTKRSSRLKVIEMFEENILEVF